MTQTSSPAQAPLLSAGPPETSGRAVLPDADGVAVRDGVRLGWERYGAAGPHVVLLPTWSIATSRIWKGQVPFLSRHARVTTFDGRGSGRSDRPIGAPAYADTEFAADAVAVMDDAGVDRAVLVGLSCGVTWAVHVAATHPERVRGIVGFGPSCGLDVPTPGRTMAWDARWDDPQGWQMYNRWFWQEGGPADFDRFLAFFFGRMFTEPHSGKQIEDAVCWARDAGPQVVHDTTAGRLGLLGAEAVPLEPLARRVRCPVVVVHGDEDAVRPAAIGRRLAELTGGTMITVAGGGHGTPARDPVFSNRVILDLVRRTDPCPAVRHRTWSRVPSRRRRALFLCSPIGLGHARRDLAVAAELRRLHPDLEVDWLAQDPVTRLLAHHGERVHPASRFLAGESRHLEDECADHDLNAFEAIRRMDEILVANFMLFDEVVAAEHYDLVVGDESWEVDHFLHENPELKRSAFAWLTDFVGWLPMPDGGEREAALTADRNAEMIAQRARLPGLRDASLFVGDPADVVDRSFGDGLPGIREWTAAQFTFTGYIGGPEPVDDEGRARLRARLGYREGEPVLLVTVGGSAVGLPLLRRVADAVPVLTRQVPGLRVVLVTGPRIAPEAVPARPGLQVHGFLPDLTDHLAACDVAVVQGGLTTTMELTANRRPFVYVPLRRHFEQNIHVRHRLERHRAGRRLDYADACDPDALAEAVVSALRTPVDYRPVGTGGAARAAALLAGLL